MTKPKQAKEEGRPLLTDVQELRQSVRKHEDQGAVTNGHKAGRATLTRLITTRSHSQDAQAESLVDMIKEILIAERSAIEIYNEIIRNLGNDNPATRIMIENVVAKEEEHAEELKTLLIAFGKM